jgi:hypothetical protein
MNSSASRQLAAEHWLERLIADAPDCGCEADKRHDITGGTLEIFCSKCGDLLDAVELEESGAEQSVRY